MGGLSTINRQLAIQLAKHSEVEVTLLVPQSACSEEVREWHHVIMFSYEEKFSWEKQRDILVEKMRDIAHG